MYPFGHRDNSHEEKAKPPKGHLSIFECEQLNRSDGTAKAMQKCLTTRSFASMTATEKHERSSVAVVMNQNDEGASVSTNDFDRAVSWSYSPPPPN